MKNNLDKQYLELVKDILENGKISKDRTGTGTIKVFGRTLRHNMQEGFPILTTRKMFYKNIIHELLWFLKGDTNIKYLVDNGVNIWVGDCYKNYCKHTETNDTTYNEWMRENEDGSLSMYTRNEFIEKLKNDDKFAEKWGELNKVYGSEWIDWYGINQIQELINTLNTNPDSRRMLVTAWNPVNVKKAVLPPCHYAFQIYTEELSTTERHKIAYKDKLPGAYSVITDGVDFNEMDGRLDEMNIPKRKISLMFQMRSVDIGLGGPSDILLYSLLLEMIAKQVNMIPDELIIHSGDTHIYLNHVDSLKEQIKREGLTLPSLKLNGNVKSIFDYKYEDIEIVDYISHDKIVLPLSN
jgi:thymidylate synthase